MAESTLISGPYGSERVPVLNQPDPAVKTGAVAPEGQRVQLNDLTVARDAGFSTARDARTRREYQPDATILESVGAAISGWDTTRLIKRLGRPSFDDDTPINAFEYLQEVPMTLSDDEREYFIDVAHGQKSAQYALDQIQNRRTAAQAVGDHPVAGMGAAFLDPLWLAVPPGIRVGKLSPVAGRTVSAIASAGIAGAVTAGGEGPVSDSEIALSMVMNGAMGGLLYHGGKLVPADHEFPKEAMDDLIADVWSQNPKARYRLVTPGKTEVVPDPDVVFHRTTEQFDGAFENRKNRTGISFAGNRGFYFGALDEPSAKIFGNHVVAARLDIKNPAPVTPINLGSGMEASPRVIVPLGKGATITAEDVRRGGLVVADSLDDVKAGKFIDQGNGFLEQVRATEKAAKAGKAYRLINPEELHDESVALLEAAGYDGIRVPEGPYTMPAQSVVFRPEQINRVASGTEAEVKAAATKEVRTQPVYEELPKPLQPGAMNTDQSEVVKAVDTVIAQDASRRGWGSKIMWNMHKTMSDFSEVGKKVANLLYDNNSDLSFTSVEAHREAILSELRTPQYKYEGLLRQAMAEDGFGIGKMVNPMTSRDAYAAQLRVEREVQRELFRREQLTREGVKTIPMSADVVPPRIAKMADALDELHQLALKELKSGGVKGAADLEVKPGYMTRKWSSHAMDTAMDKMVALGMTREAAQSKLYGLTSLALRRANGFDKKLGDQIGKSIIDRALRKGYFEDALFNAPAGEGQLKQMRDILKDGGMSHQDIERALEVMRVQSDDAGKAGFLKHRMDLDYKASMRVGDENLSIMDLIDNRVSTIVDGYVQQIGTQAAFARKGLGSRSEIEALREELLHSVPVEKRGQARDLFDNTIAHLRGDPAGARVNENFRLMQSYGRSVSLAWSGLWQLTEFATMMGQYGLSKTLKYAAQEIPGFKSMMNPTRAEASSLNNVLVEHFSASMRLRPYLAKFEDGFEMDAGSAMQLSAQTLGQMVPYANAMRYVHHYQAKIVGNLIVDRLEQAAKGNQKAREMLRGYGLESHVMDTLSQEVKQHGMNVDAWSDKVWEATRPAFAKMMDESVLRGRLGDTPAFAAFDSVGKFVFTYRTFVLTAHNKVLAGMLERNGAGAVGLVLMYQFPLALAAVQAQSVIMGKGPLDAESLTKKAAGQMGGLGLFSEPLKWATGESNSVGAPALIPIDRGVKLFQAGAHLDPQQGASTALTMIPVVSASPFIKGMASQIKE